MDDHVAVARTDDGDVVDASAHVGKQIRNFDAALSVFAERAFRPQQPRVALDELVLGLAELFGPGLAIELIQERLGTNRSDVTGAAGHEEEDPRAGLRRKRGPSGGQLAVRSGVRLVIEERRQRKPAETAAGVAEEFAAGAGDLHVRA